MKDHGGGSIINNASIAAVNAGAGMISYRSSKAAIAHATKCMAIDLAPYGIRVNCLTPAHIRSGITNYDMGPVIKYMQPLEREAQPSDVANAVAFLSSERAAQITGIVLPIDGGTTAGPPIAQTRLIMSTPNRPTDTSTGRSARRRPRSSGFVADTRPTFGHVTASKRGDKICGSHDHCIGRSDCPKPVGVRPAEQAEARDSAGWASA